MVKNKNSASYAGYSECVKQFNARAVLIFFDLVLLAKKRGYTLEIKRLASDQKRQGSLLFDSLMRALRDLSVPVVLAIRYENFCLPFYSFTAKCCVFESALGNSIHWPF